MIQINKKEKDIIYQISIFLLELIFIIGILIKISLILFPIDNIYSWELIERIIGLYTVYQIFIYATLSQMDDSEKDSYNALKSLCEESLIYLNLPLESREQNKKFKDYLYTSINEQMSPKAMNSEEVQQEYEKLLENIEHEYIQSIELKIISYNHWLTHLDLRFRKSLFLRKFKDPSFEIKWTITTIILVIIILILIYAFV